MMDPDLFASALVAGMSDALVYTDAEGIIRVWNRGAVRIFGFSEADAVGQSLDIIIPAGLRERHWQGFRRNDAHGRDALRRWSDAVGAGRAAGRHSAVGRVHHRAVRRCFWTDGRDRRDHA